ncbi:YggS family pyridoxal phosphate-dependent enzyme [Moraxella bovis]|uniref:YggS family pyridoxal phosphate-dependent enzyme n=1 Tax=Moraxella bovis TaxID=476 RepID=UPI002227E02C|nr:YggS family pyridoxal phosphate-dependent enzyme [Moraxella bovis]UYZ68264.1 YggS family pyridoxal phosphate-dependent enzyme [Moraxella bovis]UYZ70637.1 YggS family pyridoxal phosphate-dependent enzyme [Moraxella bovis]UYZ73429.1 YggS family pyridoxal phosphate-dependent enzyme [Moraxella bovis]UYZ89777.1 YggS family pyridoxal phosphate-dependent enzyme [Moraxella bovis]UZA13946.1 YggS family pyridoxal phosphate-dependent enzyme [Moraxella bovis]
MTKAPHHPSSNALIERHTAVKERLDAINDTYQADSKAVLLAVSKTKPSSDIATLYQAGQSQFGENYLQEALIKMSELAHLPITWHYIGHIQRNKTRDIAMHFDWVQTVERAIIAERLNGQRPDDRPPLNVLIQINIDDEASKSGCRIDELDGLVQTVMSLPKLTLRGLMIIPSKDGTDAFVRTKAIFDDIKGRFDLSDFDTLSMGMSGDMEQAVAHGSTMVRVGTAIFGERDYG